MKQQDSDSNSQEDELLGQFKNVKSPKTTIQFTGKVEQAKQESIQKLSHLQLLDKLFQQFLPQKSQSKIITNSPSNNLLSIELPIQNESLKPKLFEDPLNEKNISFGLQQNNCYLINENQINKPELQENSNNLKSKNGLSLVDGEIQSFYELLNISNNEQKCIQTLERNQIQHHGIQKLQKQKISEIGQGKISKDKTPQKKSEELQKLMNQQKESSKIKSSVKQNMSPLLPIEIEKNNLQIKIIIFLKKQNKTEQDYLIYQKEIQKHINFFIHPTPKTVIGKELLLNGTFLLTYIQLMTRKEKNPFLMTYMFDKFSQMFDILEDKLIFLTEKEKAHLMAKQLKQLDAIKQKNLKKENDLNRLSTHPEPSNWQQCNSRSNRKSVLSKNRTIIVKIILRDEGVQTEERYEQKGIKRHSIIKKRKEVDENSSDQESNTSKQDQSKSDSYEKKLQLKKNKKNNKDKNNRRKSEKEKNKSKKKIEEISSEQSQNQSQSRQSSSIIIPVKNKKKNKQKQKQKLDKGKSKSKSKLKSIKLEDKIKTRSLAKKKGNKR